MTIFEKIIAREIPADIVYETERVLAFRDIHPVAPTHILVIPKQPIPRVGDATDSDGAVLGELLLACRDIAKQEGIHESGYRLVTNNGAHGGQSVDHLHIHILGGRQLGWPPG
jgi:histidine triad (HIT) family protein